MCFLASNMKYEDTHMQGCWYLVVGISCSIIFTLSSKKLAMDLSSHDKCHWRHSLFEWTCVYAQFVHVLILLHHLFTHFETTVCIIWWMFTQISCMQIQKRIWPCTSLFFSIPDKSYMHELLCQQYSVYCWLLLVTTEACICMHIMYWLDFCPLCDLYIHTPYRSQFIKIPIMAHVRHQEAYLLIDDGLVQIFQVPEIL